MHPGQDTPRALAGHGLFGGAWDGGTTSVWESHSCGSHSEELDPGITPGKMTWQLFLLLPRFVANDATDGALAMWGNLKGQSRRIESESFNSRFAPNAKSAG